MTPKVGLRQQRFASPGVRFQNLAADRKGQVRKDAAPAKIRDTHVKAVRATAN